MNKGRTPQRACGPFLLLLVAACSGGSSPSSADNRQLDEAANLLDAAPDELSNIDENALRESERGNAPIGE